jgi:7-cyano-7-deazaguanine synthase
MDAPGPARAVVLLSGGLDSATTLAEARAAGFETHALTVAYGQRHAAEIEHAAGVARLLGAASHRVVAVDLAVPGASALTDPGIPVPRHRTAEAMGTGIPVTYVPARNLVLLAVAVSWAETLGASDLFLGVNAVDYSGYPDCRPEFLEAFESAAREGTRAGIQGQPIRIRAPLLHLSKAAIVLRARALGVDPAWTLSCYDPGPEGAPCGACDACLLRERGFREAGVADPARSLPRRRGAG